MGKLAYPALATLNLVLLIMLTRLICMGIILNIALSSGVKRGLIGKKARPSPTTHQHPPPVTMPARPHAPKT